MTPPAMVLLLCSFRRENWQVPTPIGYLTSLNPWRHKIAPKLLPIAILAQLQNYSHTTSSIVQTLGEWDRSCNVFYCGCGLLPFSIIPFQNLLGDNLSTDTIRYYRRRKLLFEAGRLLVSCVSRDGYYACEAEVELWNSTWRLGNNERKWSWRAKIALIHPASFVG